MMDAKNLKMNKTDIADPEKRDTLKKLAVGAYVVPATIMLLSSKRAVAQSNGEIRR